MLQVYGRPPTSEEYERLAIVWRQRKLISLRTVCPVSRIDPERDPKVCKMCGSTPVRHISGLGETTYSRDPLYGLDWVPEL